MPLKQYMLIRKDGVHMSRCAQQGWDVVGWAGWQDGVYMSGCARPAVRPRGGVGQRPALPHRRQAIFPTPDCSSTHTHTHTPTCVRSYAARTFEGVALNSHLRTSNYFYFNCLTGAHLGVRGGGACEGA